MANTNNGTPVNFSFGSAAGITVTEQAGILLQSLELSNESNRTIVKDGNGDRTSSIHNDKIRKASLKWTPKGTSLADAIANSLVPYPGGFFTITACAARTDMASPTIKWEIISAKGGNTNDAAATMDIDLEYAPNIQAVAS